MAALSGWPTARTAATGPAPAGPIIAAFGARPSCRSGRAGLAFAKLDPADLSGQCLGEVVDELDRAWVRVGGEPLAHELLDLLGELVRGLDPGQDAYERLDDV